MPRIDIHQVYLRIAKNYSKMSYAKRNKVGAILTFNGRIVSTGYNGMPTKMTNSCEVKIHDRKELVTRSEVIHAEMNAILFAAKNGQSTNDCILYVTLSPCVECAKAIIQSGIIKVYYIEPYRDTGGLDLLEFVGIECVQIKC